MKVFKVTPRGYCKGVVGAIQIAKETKKNYPFDFQLDITYRLTGQTITTEWEVTNLGDEEMPFQIGGHPAFYIPAFGFDQKEIHNYKDFQECSRRPSNQMDYRNTMRCI